MAKRSVRAASGAAAAWKFADLGFERLLEQERRAEVGLGAGLLGVDDLPQHLRAEPVAGRDLEGVAEVRGKGARVFSMNPS